MDKLQRRVDIFFPKTAIFTEQRCWRGYWCSYRLESPMKILIISFYFYGKKVFEIVKRG